MRRVVVTGVGMVGPLGISVNESWSNLLSLKSGVKRVRDIKPELPDVYMGLISGFDAARFPIEYCHSNLNAYTMSAVQEALEMSGVEVENRDDVGVNIGVMNSNMSKVTDIVQQASTKGFNRVSAFTMLHVLSNIPTALVTIKYKILGPSSTSSSACATGASAIGDSYRRIKYGETNVMIAGGAEDSFNSTAIYSSMRMQAMSTKIYDDPSKASRPFDRDRSGFILSEGAGVVILEEYEHAKNRSANILCEISGYGESSDAFHLTRPMDYGEGGLRAMKKAINNSGDVDIINCHATSTQAGDLSEARAIGESKAILVANKSQLGHTFGAAGAIESIFSILSIKESVIPATINLDNPIVTQFSREPQYQKVNRVLKNAFGFGGVNVSLLFTSI